VLIFKIAHVYWPRQKNNAQPENQNCVFLALLTPHFQELRFTGRSNGSSSPQTGKHILTRQKPVNVGKWPPWAKQMLKIDRALGGPSKDSIEGPPSALSVLVITMAHNSIQHGTCYYSVKLIYLMKY
jgi:hypothetical protein